MIQNVDMPYINYYIIIVDTLFLFIIKYTFILILSTAKLMFLVANGIYLYNKELILYFFILDNANKKDC